MADKAIFVNYLRIQKEADEKKATNSKRVFILTKS